MTKWMTSGASRLKANLNRSFGARKNKKAAANCRVKSYDTVVASAKIGERRKNSNGKSRCRVQRNPVMASIGRHACSTERPLIVFYYFDIALFSVNYFLGICCDAASCSHSFYPISCASYVVVESRLRERGNIYSSDWMLHFVLDFDLPTPLDLDALFLLRVVIQPCSCACVVAHCWVWAVRVSVPAQLELRLLAAMVFFVINNSCGWNRGMMCEWCWMHWCTASGQRHWMMTIDVARACFVPYLR